MTISTYNNNPGYEIMAAVIDSPLCPYEDGAKADITEILRLCYVYSVDAGTPKELTAAALAGAILTHLAMGYGIPDFQKYAQEYWNGPAEPAPDE